MKKNLKIILILVAVVIIGVFVYYQSKKPALINEQPPITAKDSVVGCYVATLSKDVYTLAILSQVGETFEGTLRFKNFEKDSSSGTYEGTYKDGILLGDYSFSSEGMDSVMQVIFKKSGDDFVRGYGDVDESGTRFIDINNITYDTSTVFKKSGECATIL